MKKSPTSPFQKRCFTLTFFYFLRIFVGSGKHISKDFVRHLIANHYFNIPLTMIHINFCHIYAYEYYTAFSDVHF